MTRLPLCLVTGAGRGIGAAIARRIARTGSPVLCAARSQDACVEVAALIRAESGIAWPIYVDVTDPETLDASLADLEKEIAPHGPIAWLVNNAGIAETAPFLRPRTKDGEDLFEKHMRVNFHGARRTTERLAPSMIERGYGRIVHVASSAGLRGYPYASAYVASKHALVGYARSAALELAKTGVTLNCVCPHYVDSPMTDGTIARIVAKTGRNPIEVRAFLAAENPGGTLISTDEVAMVVLDLLQGDKNGAIVELLGGKGLRPDAETIAWRS